MKLDSSAPPGHTSPFTRTHGIGLAVPTLKIPEARFCFTRADIKRGRVMRAVCFVLQERPIMLPRFE